VFGQIRQLAASSSTPKAIWLGVVGPSLADVLMLKPWRLDALEIGPLAARLL
jgi:hypothetical protein